MEYNNFLMNLGFTEQETKIYLILLEYGGLHISDISRKTKINRVTLYNILPKMIDSNLISQTKKTKGKIFKAENPEKLELIFARNKLIFDKNIKKLKEIYSHKKERPIIKFLEGSKGIDATLEDMVISSAKGSTIYRYSARKNTGKKIKHNNYYKIRDQKKIERLVITNEEKAKRKKPKLERFVKTIPKEFDLFEDNVSQFIYANKIAFMDYENKLSFIIESEKVAKFQEKIFKLL